MLAPRSVTGRATWVKPASGMAGEAFRGAAGDVTIAHPGPAMTSPTEYSPAHRIEIRVRYPECDPMGVAHHAAYPVWLEIGRTELLRQGGVSYQQLEAEG